MDSHSKYIIPDYPLITDSSDDYTNYNTIAIKQKGGNPDDKMEVLKKVPTGSFPPIFIISKQEKEKEEQSKARGYSARTNKTALSIKEIMQDRRDDSKPFISL